MAGKPIKMEKLKQLMLLHQQGVPIKQIGRTLEMSKNTVKSYLRRIQSAALQPENLLSLPYPELQGKVLAGNPSYKKPKRYDALIPDLAYYYRELKRRGVTRHLLWQEYRQAHAGGYSYSQFCFHLKQYSKASKPSMVLHHVPGDKLFVDFAGQKQSYIDRATGEIIECQVFVACLAASDYGFALAVPSQSVADFIYALEQCLQHLGGVPRALVTDNLKSSVIKASRYEPKLNDTLMDFANHYGMALTPTRVVHPKDKALVENQVRLVYARVYAKLRNEQFFDIETLNSAIQEKMLQHNQTRMQHKNYCRQEQYLAVEKPLLHPLPQEAFEIKTNRILVVAPNNHVWVGQDKRHYSVPYMHIGKKAMVVITRNLVRIYIDSQQVACHKRTLSYGYTTEPQHLCSTHKHYMGRSPAYYQQRARKESETFYQLTLNIFNQSQYPELLYRTCDGLFALYKKYGQADFECACRIALHYEHYAYGFIKNLLEKGIKEPGQVNEKSLPKHDNVRGSEYYK